MRRESDSGEQFERQMAGEFDWRDYRWESNSRDKWRESLTGETID